MYRYVANCKYCTCVLVFAITSAYRSTHVTCKFQGIQRTFSIEILNILRISKSLFGLSFKNIMNFSWNFLYIEIRDEWIADSKSNHWQHSDYRQDIC